LETLHAQARSTLQDIEPVNLECRMRHSGYLLCTICILLANTAADARSPEADQRDAHLEKLRAKFAAADADHDGLLARNEAVNGMPRVAKHFDEADADRDGRLSMAEVTAYIARARAARSK
jgi:hypothetical protein